jgi:hypothetical protein
MTQGHYSTGPYFSTTYTEKNDPKTINSTERGVVFLRRIFIGGGGVWVTFLRRKMTHGSIYSTGVTSLRYTSEGLQDLGQYSALNAFGQ